MDIAYYTDFRELIQRIEPRLIPPFIIGLIYGGFVMTTIWKEWWSVLVIILLMPVALVVTGTLLPVDVNFTYRLFFLGVVALGVGGLSYYLAR